MANSSPPLRHDYKVFYPITTRWKDNDIYGHVNNVTYYAYFDSAVNRYLIEAGGLDIHSGRTIAFVVNSSCQYLSPVAFPEQIEAGIRVDRLGNSSVHYGVAIFRHNEAEACASGQFVHVFVNRETQRPVSIPAPLREALAKIAV